MAVLPIIGIIPARFGATRFPGKPLALLGGKPVIQHVFEQASKANLSDGVVVATDDARIVELIEKLGGQVMLTDPNHPSGTDRCAEVTDRMGFQGIVINIQGDEPFVQPHQINQLARTLQTAELPAIATLAVPVANAADLHSPHVVKVVTDSFGKALYFSRAAIPFQRDNADMEAWILSHRYLRHIGLYAYHSQILSQLTELPLADLEKCEHLEQLRWMQSGFNIWVSMTEQHHIGIDTPQDLERAEAWYQQHKHELL